MNYSLSGNPALLYQTPEVNSPNFGGTTETNDIYTTRRKKKSKLPVIIGSTVSVFAVFWVVVGVFAMSRHKAKTAQAVALAAAAG